MTVYAFQTVDSFLEAFGHRRLGNPTVPTVRGHVSDHVVELQLIVAAVNGTNYEYPREKMDRLIVFFQSNQNYQSLTPIQNRTKGAAIWRLIHGNRRLAGDDQWIASVQTEWIILRKLLLPFQVIVFLRSMDLILSR